MICCSRVLSFLLLCAILNQVDCNRLNKFCVALLFLYTTKIYLFILATFGHRFNEIQFNDNLRYYAYIPTLRVHTTPTHIICCANCTYLWTKSKYIHFLTALLTRPLFFVVFLFLVYHKPKLCNSIQSSHDNISFKQISQSFSRLFAPLSLEKMLFKTLFKRPACDAFQFLRICTNARFRLYTYTYIDIDRYILNLERYYLWWNVIRR